MPQPRTGAPTISDVAREAGVGRATAARTLGGYGYVSPAMQDKVLAAAERLGYRANALARSMSTGVTHTIGVIIADIGNPFFAGVMRGISDTARARGVDTLVISSHEHLEEEVSAMNTLINKRVDGIILSTSARTAAGAGHISAAAAQGIPVVLVDRAIPELGLDEVVIDNRAAARLAVSELISAGHQRIGFVWGPPSAHRPAVRRELVDASANNLFTEGERLEGYLDALDDAGLPCDLDLVMVGEKTAEHAKSEVTRMLELEQPPTALFCTESDAIVGALRAIRQARLRVPEDISLIGFDDNPWAEVMDPPLSMIAQPMHELGARAADKLFERIDSPAHAAERITLDTGLIRRDSVQARSHQTN
ncbi:LacI family DNA-binding transcriptional regulator [Glutamicibacter endophyticus]